MCASADDFFVDASGSYAFVPSLVGRAHEWCQAKVRAAMARRKAPVIVDNTNTQVRGGRRGRVARMANTKTVSYSTIWQHYLSLAVLEGLPVFFFFWRFLAIFFPHGDFLSLSLCVLQSWEMHPYLRMSAECGYRCLLLEPWGTPWRRRVGELARRTRHRVPREKIAIMEARQAATTTTKKKKNPF